MLTSNFFKDNEVAIQSYRDGSYFVLVNGDYIDDDLESSILNELRSNEHLYSRAPKSTHTDTFFVRSDDEIIKHLGECIKGHEKSIVQRRKDIIQCRELLNVFEDKKRPGGQGGEGEGNTLI